MIKIIAMKIISTPIEATSVKNYIEGYLKSNSSYTARNSIEGLRRDLGHSFVYSWITLVHIFGWT